MTVPVPEIMYGSVYVVLNSLADPHFHFTEPRGLEECLLQIESEGSPPFLRSLDDTMGQFNSGNVRTEVTWCGMHT
jgi:hypothetical protein